MSGSASCSSTRSASSARSSCPRCRDSSVSGEVGRVAPPPRVRSRMQPERRRLLRFVPGAKPVLIAAGVAVLGAGAYTIARETSVFAVRTFDIVGGSPRVQQELRSALAPELGRSLLRVDAGELDRRVAAIPDVIGVTFDRR